MAEAQISGVLKQLVSLAARELQLESRLVLSGDREVRKLESKLRTIQAVLGDAERRQFNEQAVKLWLDNLKDTSYELDDVLDEWNTEMIRSEIEKEEVEQAEIPHRDLKKVCSIFFSSCCFRRVDRLKIRHDIAFKKINLLNGVLDEITTMGENFKFVMTKGTKEIQRPKTNFFIQVSDVVGRDYHMEDLMHMLLGNSRQEEISPHVISLVGMGGIGKTTLARLAYNHDMVKDHFDLTMWVGVSDPFDPCQIAKEIIDCVGDQSPNAAELQILLSRICDLIGGKRFFIVLDDVWNEDYTLWEPFKQVFKYGAQGSTILVTTRKESTARMMKSASIISLELMSMENCWMLFRKIAFFEKDPEQFVQFEELGWKLLIRCKGLPIAVKILGGLMRLKNSRAEWKEVLDSSLWEFEDFQSGLWTPLLLSYIELPSAMKQCFSYCAVFPKDTLLKRDELVQLWMAQGYLDSKANVEMEIERLGEEYFENLAVRFFFSDWEADVADGRILQCKMHGIVHDFAQFLMKEECFTIFDEHDQQLGTEFLCERTRHLSLRFENGAQFPTSVYRAKNLRSLLTLGTVCPNSVLLGLFQHFPYLRALNLSCTSIQELPHEVEKLIHLRYLNLSHNYVMKRLPETICNLCNLQYLDVTMCSCLEKLPGGMGKLISLRHLILKNADLITSLPKGIGRLIYLRRLDSFIIGGYDNIEGCRLGELKNLNHLEGDLTIKGLENVVDVYEAESAELKNKKYLRCLRLEFGLGYGRREKDVMVLNALEPNIYMESLEICGFQGTLLSSSWMMSLVGLKSLVLRRFSKMEIFPPLGRLPFLESLVIHDAGRVRKVGTEFLAIDSEDKTDVALVLFPNLRSLIFVGMKEWEEWHGIGWLGDGEEFVVIMPRLQKLEIIYCPKLEALPDFLHMTPLLELTLHGNPFLGARYQRETGEDWPKISHVPNIIIDF